MGTLLDGTAPGCDPEKPLFLEGFTGQGRLSGAVPWGQQSTKESRPQGSQGPEECWARQSRAHLPGAPMPNACTTVAWP